MATKPQKPIEEQIAELNEEQKISILENGKRFDLISIVSFIVMIGVMGAWSFLSFIMINGAQANYVLLKNKYDATSILSEEYHVILEQWLDALDTYTNMKILFFIGIAAIAMIEVIIIFIRIFRFKKKYPYYSDKKYAFLKKEEKMKKNVSDQ